MKDKSAKKNRASKDIIEYPMQAEYIRIDGTGSHNSHPVDDAFDLGQRDANDYTVATLINMLQGPDILDNYEALGAIGKRKIKEALPYLKSVALYDEDLGLKEEAIRTIRKISGKEAIDILRFLRSTEHKEFIDENIKLPSGKR